MLRAKNYENQPMFHSVIQKIKVAPCFFKHGVYCQSSLLTDSLITIEI